MNTKERTGWRLLKKYLGQIIFNSVIALSGLLMFGATDISDSKGGSVALILLLMSILSAGNYSFIKMANSGKKAFQPSYVLTEQTFDSLNEPKDYLEVMKDLKNYPLCRNEAAQMIEQWNTYRKKAETLDAISSSGGVYEVVNQDVESVMLNNMILFMKRAAILQSASRSDEIAIHRKYLTELVGRNDKVLKDYTELLIEASQLTGDDSGKAEVKSLNMIIESIRAYRQELESGDKNE